MDKKSIIYLIILLVVFGVALGVIYYVYNSQVEVNFQFTHTTKHHEKISPRAILSLQSTSPTNIAGQPTTIKMLLDTQSNPVDGVDIFLSYSNLEPITDNFINLSQSVFANVVGLRIDQVKKTIRFSVLPKHGQSFSGLGEVISMNFIAKNAGPAAVNLNFEPGSTIDCNVSYFKEGQDILWQVSNLNLTMQ